LFEEEYFTETVIDKNHTKTIGPEIFLINNGKRY